MRIGQHSFSAFVTYASNELVVIIQTIFCTYTPWLGIFIADQQILFNFRNSMVFCKLPVLIFCDISHWQRLGIHYILLRSPVHSLIAQVGDCARNLHLGLISYQQMLLNVPQEPNQLQPYKCSCSITNPCTQKSPLAQIPSRSTSSGA